MKETPSAAPVNAKGIVYVALGDVYFLEACVSAASAKRWLKDVPVTIFTSSDLPDAEGVFDTRIPITQSAGKAHRDKLVWMPETPYEQTLFLDTDTYVCGDIAPLFRVLERFDLGVCREDGALPEAFFRDVPDIVGEWNTGVIVYPASEAVKNMFRVALEWYDRYAMDPVMGPLQTDQAGFRCALYHSRLRVAPLSARYNCRFAGYGCVGGSVAIVHGRPRYLPFDAVYLDKAARKLNISKRERVYLGGALWSLASRWRVVKQPYAKAERGFFGFLPWYLVKRFFLLIARHGARSVIDRWKFHAQRDDGR